MSREIMQQAVDTLDRLWEIGIDAEYGVPLLPIMHVLRQELAKPEQEFKHTEYGLRGDENGKLSIGEIPRKEWVGLTDEELNLIYAEPQTHAGQYARAIEIKLKEKNT
jgi:hypothetical protein